MSVVLVTGGSGFVATYVIAELINSGYQVRTTVRSLDREKDVQTMLSLAGVDKFDNLSFFVADLTFDEGWTEAVTGCDYVLHVASPLSQKGASEDEIVKIAQEGTLRVAKFSHDLGVKHLVFTSSFGAVGYGPSLGRPFTEEDWTDSNLVSGYIKSKTIAEKDLWNFYKQYKTPELTVFNPTGIFGPTLSPRLSSLSLIQMMMNGLLPGCPDISFGITDVRDLAKLEVAALINPKAKGERFIVASIPTIKMVEIAKILKEHCGNRAPKLIAEELPNDKVPPKMATDLGIVRDLSNAKVKAAFSWEPTSYAKTLVDSAESLIKFGLIQT